MSVQEGPEIKGMAPGEMIYSNRSARNGSASRDTEDFFSRIPLPSAKSRYGSRNWWVYVFGTVSRAPESN